VQATQSGKHRRIGKRRQGGKEGREGGGRQEIGKKAGGGMRAAVARTCGIGHRGGKLGGARLVNGRGLGLLPSSDDMRASAPFNLLAFVRLFARGMSEKLRKIARTREIRRGYGTRRREAGGVGSQARSRRRPIAGGRQWPNGRWICARRAWWPRAGRGRRACAAVCAGRHMSGAGGTRGKSGQAVFISKPFADVALWYTHSDYVF